MSKARVVSIKELAEHGTKYDAWMCIRGKVYDVTEYFPSHPGGEVPITKGFGKDATALFDRVHPYVDFETLLAGHEIGVLEAVKESPSQIKAEKESKQESKNTSCCCFRLCRRKGRRKGLPKMKLFDSNDSILFVVTFPRGNSTETDWTIGIIDKSTLIIRKITSKADVWVGQFKLKETLIDDTINFEFAKDFDSLELSIQKPKTGRKWDKIGTPEGDHNQIVDSRSTNDAYDACIVYRQKVTPNTYLFGIRLKPCSYFGVPIGFHTKIYIGDVKKPYTPVCYSMMSEDEPDLAGGLGQIIWYIIKVYPAGELTPKILQLPVLKDLKDDKPPVYTLKLGSPQGSFDFEFLKSKTTEVILLMAGGTGITPMTKIISWCLQKVRKAECSKQVLLLFWNHTQEDIIWNHKFEELGSKESSWFHFFPILTNPGPKWDGLTGHVTTQQIQEIIDTLPFEISNSTAKQGYICGSHGFNTAVEEAVQGIIQGDNLHIFAG